MRGYRFSLDSTLLGALLGAVITGGIGVYRKLRDHKINKEKLDLTDELNQRIGYLKCKLDELHAQKESFRTNNIFRRFSNRKQVELIEIEINALEQQIKSFEQRIMEIRSSNSMRMHRYVERTPSKEVSRPVKLLPAI